MKLYPNLGMLLIRLALGAMFIHAGLMKFLVFGFNNFIAQSAGAIPPYLPAAVGKAYLYFVPFGEVIIGLLVAVGLATRLSAFVMALMLLSFMMAVTGFVENNGPHSSLLYMCIALGLALAGPGSISGDGFLQLKRKLKA